MGENIQISQEGKFQTVYGNNQPSGRWKNSSPLLSCKLCIITSSPSPLRLPQSEGSLVLASLIFNDFPMHRKYPHRLETHQTKSQDTLNNHLNASTSCWAGINFKSSDSSVQNCRENSLLSS